MPTFSGPADPTPAHSQPIEQLAVNTIRTLAIDAVQKADSGHPGAPMALAPVAYSLWQDYLRFDPADPLWPNRDRFVLSNGHASMLLYSLLHLSGTRAVDAKREVTGEPAVSLDDIKRFRQWGSRTPGHPEYRHVSGVETTTGPLGQGAANSVGMAISGLWQGAYFNRTGYPLFNYRVFAIVSDGDLMEGVSAEAASVAGHLKLHNLCWIYDNNGITIDGNTQITFTEDVGARFRAYGWRVHHLHDANDLGQLDEAYGWFEQAGEGEGPSLIIVDTHIGFGAPNKVNTSSAHGEPLGEKEVALAKRSYGWPEDAHFLVPPEVPRHFQEGLGKRGGAIRSEWHRTFDGYRRQYPELAAQLEAMSRHELPAAFPTSENDGLSPFPADAKGQATRDTSQKVMNTLLAQYPWFVGGCADLIASTKAVLKYEGAGNFTPSERGGRNIHYGIREHAMGAISNGLALSGLRPFASTFLIFSDYERPAIRLSALMGLPIVQIFSHDSIGLGEDGPTHQPIEQLISLRAIPGLIVLRPADANEVLEAWRVIVRLKDHPVALILTRQKVPTIDRARFAPASGVAKGGYVLAEAQGGSPQAILIATGSEIAVAVEAWEKLNREGIRTRVVSLPSWELFDRQSETYRNSVLPPGIEARVSIEAGSTLGWQKYVGNRGHSIGMTTFGASAPIKDLMEKFGFTSDHAVRAVRQVLGKG
jgi:transketolase